ncbi:hypothetical protein CC85DRAFT_282151 [Cutaneotrichosporon oleaginosum]|uniref:BTB domain-containing protein n=1 Tax=Cutaneotrichosporon oleaginosum TaxID=879819 RepID=A0A0J0XY85_9TREE|nr:uncharacterized protein CC85DRAFT_282151 [Cutaneotrichosporon oleaginosum]KLT46013.1 hypothetical protein CC85DRAFT_282151 [Cutaneotrichosporon oleaginosum]TXT06707.1 hypothetical protein COLE_06038 [Cutaneotrichosporon oleaginosum]
MSGDESSKRRKQSTPPRGSSPSQSVTQSPRAIPQDHLIDDEYWTDGDFEIVTSNGIRFRVPSYHLFAASWIFRNARKLAPPNDARIRLTDPVCETGYVFRLFMQLAEHGQLDGVGQQGIFKVHIKLHHLFLFLKKWDCPGLLAVLHHSISRLVEEDRGLDRSRMFIVAALNGDTRLCSRILEVSAKDVWGANRDGTPDAMIDAPTGTHIWDPYHWPVWFQLHCPPLYAWAVARAWGLVMASSPPEHERNPKAFGGRFVAFLEEVQDRQEIW